MRVPGFLSLLTLTQWKSLLVHGYDMNQCIRMSTTIKTNRPFFDNWESVHGGPPSDLTEEYIIADVKHAYFNYWENSKGWLLFWDLQDSSWNLGQELGFDPSNMASTNFETVPSFYAIDLWETGNPLLLTVTDWNCDNVSNLQFCPISSRTLSQRRHYSHYNPLLILQKQKLPLIVSMLEHLIKVSNNTLQHSPHTIL